MVMINADASYVPTSFKSEAWQEMWGQKVNSYMRQLSWIKDDACDVLASRTVDEGGNHDQTFIEPIYKGVVGDKTKALLLGQQGKPLRVFYVVNDQAFEALKYELKKNKGFLDQQIAEIGTTLTDNNAAALYAWQDSFFGIAQNVNSVLRLSKIAKGVAAKKVSQTSGGKDSLISEGEAVDLIKAMAKRYDVKNIDLTISSSGWFAGGTAVTLGYVSPLDDATTPYALPFGVKMWLNDTALYKHTAIHEMAHAIELFKNGLSAHGKGFRKIYKLLLKQYMHIDAVGL